MRTYITVADNLDGVRLCLRQSQAEPLPAPLELHLAPYLAEIGTQAIDLSQYDRLGR